MRIIKIANYQGLVRNDFKLSENLSIDQELFRTGNKTTIVVIQSIEMVSKKLNKKRTL